MKLQENFEMSKKLRFRYMNTIFIKRSALQVKSLKNEPRNMDTIVICDFNKTSFEISYTRSFN